MPVAQEIMIPVKEAVTMERKIPRQRNSHGGALDFERERLLNLIDSKIRRKEMEIAKGFAEELFRTEMEFALLGKAKKLRRYNSMILKVMRVLLTVLLMSVTCTVLNIYPFYNLLAQVITILAIISVIGTNSFLIERFGRAMKMTIEGYETVRQSFIDRLLDSFLNNSSPDMALRMLNLNVA
ncbi:MAG TPA: hypothetical protein DCP92_10405 [Nitrospiraceae bacterium]|jgi:hypothetical protein|nr:hypothetical protein [Nitrospiraceae bacterium]